MYHAESLCFARVFSNEISGAQRGFRLQEGRPTIMSTGCLQGRKVSGTDLIVRSLAKISECRKMARIKAGGGRRRGGHPNAASRTHSTTRDKCKKISTNVHSYLSSTEHVVLKLWTLSHQPLQEETRKKEAIRINLSLCFNLSACRKGRISNAYFSLPIKNYKELIKKKKNN